MIDPKEIDAELTHIADLIRGRDHLFYDDGPIGELAGFVRTLAYVAERDRKTLRRIQEVLADEGCCKVFLGLADPDPRSNGCDQPTCMRCYPEPGDRRGR